MNKLQNPIDESIKETIVNKLYYRWDKISVMDHVMEKYELDQTEKDRLWSILCKIEIEVSKLRLKIGKIN